MTHGTKDPLLLFGKAIARVLGWISAIAGIAIVLLIPAVLLFSQNMLPGLGSADEGSVVQASPLSVVAILVMMALILAALFQFFGKLGAIIVSVGEGDPFTPENATRLDAMAWLFLGVKILALLIGGLRLHLANLVAGPSDGRDSLDLSFYDLDAVVIVSVLLILARVFRHGAAMRDDLKGTV